MTSSTYSKSAYSDLLRDPRWQRKRLEIMKRDEFRCRHCGSDTITLNVHHCFYRDGHKPWEYPDGSLITLCEDCHEEETIQLKKALKHLASALGSRGFQSGEVQRLATAFFTTAWRHHPLGLVNPLCWLLGDEQALQRLSDDYQAYVKGRIPELVALLDKVPSPEGAA